AQVAAPSLFLTVTHSLRYFYSSSSGVSNFPEFVAVGLVDDVQMIHYDSNTQKAEFKQQWMEKAAEDDPEYSFLMKLFNQTKMSHLWENIKYFLLLLVSGVHINQMMYGCEWDDEMAEVNGYHYYGYDGEDFILFDLQTETWVAPVMQAVITKLEALSARQKNYFTHICPEWLKKYLNYSGSSLRRTGAITHDFNWTWKDNQSFIGFYPHKAKLLWRKDGKELHEGVNRGEILPNNDGTLQTSADLDLSSVKPEDWRSYDCVSAL
uniref:MHC class I-like antigen recognition-like domain-containing protein n=1 Tax=Oreochromis niloticus TaxID=8128 RepID=A0A669F862_ORENI